MTGRARKTLELKKTGGMITVEVSVIIPIITLLITGVVFFLLFFVDMSAVKGETLLITNEVADCWKTEGELSSGDYREEKLLKRDVYFLIKNQRKALIKKAESRLNERLQERLMLTQITQKKVQIKANLVSAEVTVQFLWPLSRMAEYMGTEGLTFSCRSVSPVENQEEQLRRLKSQISKR